MDCKFEIGGRNDDVLGDFVAWLFLKVGQWTHVLFVLLILIAVSFNASAMMQFRSFDMGNGLPNNTIKAIDQDKDGYLWIGTSNGLCRFDGMSFLTYRHGTDLTKSIRSNTVNCLLTVENGVWVGSLNGLSFFDFDTQNFRTSERIDLKTGKREQFSASVRSIVKVSNLIFVLDENKHLYQLGEDGVFAGCMIKPQTLYNICPFENKFLLTYSYDGLHLLNPVDWSEVSHSHGAVSGESISLYYFEPEHTVYVSNGKDRQMEAYRIENEYRLQPIDSKEIPRSDIVGGYDNKTLFGTNGRGLIYDHKDFTTKNSSISGDVITSFFTDKDNNLWIGTYRNGLNVYSPSFDVFSSLNIDNRKLSHKLATAVLAVGDKIYVGTDGGGLDVYDTTDGRLVNYNTDNSGIIGDAILSLVMDGQYIWAASYSNGISKFDTATQTFSNFPLKNEYLWRIADDGKGKIWVLGRGVSTIDKQTNKISHFERLNNIWASSIAFDSDKTWVGTSGHGIFVVNNNDMSVIDNIKESKNNKTTFSNDAPFIFADKTGGKWIGIHNNGLFKFCNDSNSLGVNVIPSCNIASMIKDKEGFIWVATDNGLYRLGEKDSSFNRFGNNDGLPSTQFLANSAYRKGDTLFFGTTNGVVQLNTSFVKPINNNNHININSVGLLNSDSTLNIISTNQALLLKHDENFFTVNFSQSDLINASKLNFSCKLEAFDKDWRNLGSARSATYTNVPPGHYRFCIRSSTWDGKWGNNISSIEINILSPWWATWWAILLWTALTIAILLIIFKVYRSQKDIKKKVKEEEFEKNLIKKDYEMRLRFFTNISHEFRTPLSLIISPLTLLMNEEHDEHHRERLSVMLRNAKNLLNLVNQLLDFRKLEMNGEKFSPSFGNLIEFVELILSDFHERAKAEHKELTFIPKSDQLYTSFDKDKMRKIINNLLSNAFKFTTEGCQIKVIVESNRKEHGRFAIIKVTDNGAGIATENQDKIFKCFYQIDDETVNTGTGIGLHMVKEYAKMHSGDVIVSSTFGKGSEFTVRFLITHPEETSIATEDVVPAAESVQKSSSQYKYKILVVEDNQEFRKFMSDYLKTEYEVFEASDGETGEQLALEQRPDIIISDIMMPNVDGIELCRRLKSNIETSHIPFIILTAKASNESMRTGYGVGADDYISKPFDVDIFNLKLRNLINQIEDRKAQFERSVEIRPKEITITSIDEKLMTDVLAAIESNIDNPEYSIDNLSAEVCVGRTNLYKKIQALTGKTPATFFRTVRLKKAASLLLMTDMTVSGISVAVGFGSIKYFNKYFKEEFDATPSEYRASKRQ